MKKHLLYFTCAGAIVLSASIASAQTSVPVPIAPAANPIPSATTFSPRPNFDTYRSFDPFNSYANIGPFPQSKFYEQAYEIAQQYGRCATNVSPKRVRAVLDASPNTRTEIVELSMLTNVSRACLPYNYRPGFIFMRGSLAEAMYKRQPATAALHSDGTTQSQFDAFMAAETARSGARLPDDRDFVSISNCLVVRAPGAARAVLLSKHGSLDERRHLNDLLAAAPSCSKSPGFATTASASFARAYLAESALRWSEFS